jgi:YggT family protein
VFVIGNLFISLGRLLQTVTQVYLIIVVVGAVLTWVPVDPYNPVVRFLNRLTLPVYEKLRRWLPRPLWDNSLHVDFMPWAVFLLLLFLSGFLFQSLIDIGYRLK